MLSSVAVSTILVASAVDAFHVFQYNTPGDLIKGFGVSAACSQALNATLNCDERTMARAAEGPDNYYWSQDSVTALCTSPCASSLASWTQSVSSTCNGQSMKMSGVNVSAIAYPEIFSRSYDLVCTQDSSQNWCFYESQTWVGSDYIRYDPDICENEDPLDNPPECSDPDFSPNDITPDMKAMTNLYNQSFYCSECFLRNLKQRLRQPLLEDSLFTDYLMEQYQDLQQVCSFNEPVTTFGSVLFPGLPTLAPSSSTPTRTVPASATASPTCLGQLVTPVARQRICGDIIATYNVSLGDAVAITGDRWCEITEPVCLPKPCVIDKVMDEPTCEALAARYGVSLATFNSWNPNFIGNCGKVAIAQAVCAGPPGGMYKPSGPIYAPTQAGSYYETAKASEPTQTGTTGSCGLFYNVVSGDTCQTVALRFGITFDDLMKLNSYLNSDCTNLWLNYAVCVAPVSPSPRSTDGLCGSKHGHATCNGTAFGSCCSTSGYCGDSSDYCGPGNCASGACTGTTAGVTTNGTCGPSYGGLKCENPSFGPCCSIYGYCGSGSDFCGPGNCYSGTCDPDNGGKSVDGSCGPQFAGNKTCTGTQFGNCCSTSGYCGSTSDYCGSGNCYSGACQH